MKITISPNGEVLLQSDNPADEEKFKELFTRFEQIPGVKVTEGEIENHRTMSDADHLTLHQTNTNHAH